MDTDTLMQKAVALCRTESGTRLKIMFGLAEIVHALERKDGGKYRPSDTRGLCRHDAIKSVREHCLKGGKQYGYNVPRSDAYWYGGVRSLEVWTPKQRRTLIERDVSWINVAPMQALPDFGASLIVDLQAGRIATINMRPKHTPVRKTRRNEIESLVEFRVTGAETQEELQDKLESLLSVIKRLGYDIDVMTQCAIVRVVRGVHCHGSKFSDGNKQGG